VSTLNASDEVARLLSVVVFANIASCGVTAPSTISAMNAKIRQGVFILLGSGTVQHSGGDEIELCMKRSVKDREDKCEGLVQYNKMEK